MIPSSISGDFPVYPSLHDYKYYSYERRLKIDFFKISTSQKKVANRQVCIQATLDPEANQDGNDKMTTASVNATQKAADMKW